MSTPRIEAAELIAKLLGFTEAQSIAPQDVAAGVDGASLDLGATYQHPAIVVWNFATASATTVFTPDADDSDDDAAFSAVAAADLIGGAFPTITVANDNAVFARAYTGGKRYLRAAIADDSGGTPALLASASIIKSVSLAHLKPYEIEQIMFDLNRRGWDQGAGEPPTGQARLNALIV